MRYVFLLLLLFLGCGTPEVFNVAIDPATHASDRHTASYLDGPDSSAVYPIKKAGE